MYFHSLKISVSVAKSGRYLWDKHKRLVLRIDFRCGSTKNVYTEKNHYMRNMGPFPRYGHIMLAIIMGIPICYVL